MLVLGRAVLTKQVSRARAAPFAGAARAPEPWPAHGRAVQKPLTQADGGTIHRRGTSVALRPMTADVLRRLTSTVSIRIGRLGCWGFNPKTPNAARMYDYALGGKDNFAADREAADAILRESPHAYDAAHASRKFLRRAVRYVVESGVTQIVDIGSGLPTMENTHEIAIGVNKLARVVYVDYAELPVMPTGEQRPWSRACQPHLRMDVIWSYVLLGEDFVKNWESKGMRASEALEMAHLRRPDDPTQSSLF